MVLETISSLKVPAKIRQYRKSDVIFDEGTTGVEMFIIYSGSVRLSTKEPGREITLATIGPGEFFGEMAVIDSAFRTATAVADEDGTKLVVLDQKKFREIVREHPEFAMTIMQHLCRRLRNRWTLYDQMKKGDTGKGGKLELTIKSVNLEEINVALKVLLNQMKRERLDSEAKVVANVQELVFPYLERLRNSKLDARQKECLSVIETNLNNIIAPFMQNLSIAVLQPDPHGDEGRQPHQGRQDDKGDCRSAEPVALHGGLPPQQHPLQARPEEQGGKPQGPPAEAVAGGIKKGQGTRDEG